jgi:hypothetical protein
MQATTMDRHLEIVSDVHGLPLTRLELVDFNPGNAIQETTINYIIPMINSRNQKIKTSYDDINKDSHTTLSSVKQ